MLSIVNPILVRVGALEHGIVWTPSLYNELDGSSSVAVCGLDSRVDSRSHRVTFYVINIQ